jgi:predicted GNAT family N-acyltransferase
MPLENITVRILNETELEHLYALRQEVLRKPLGMDLYNEDLKSEKEQIKIGAFHNQELIGCVMLKISDDCAKLRQMAIKADFQGVGIGKDIVLFAEQYCLDHHISKIELHSRKNAIGFYKRLKYVAIDEEFLEVGLPHFKMQKVLS